MIARSRHNIDVKDYLKKSNITTEQNRLEMSIKLNDEGAEKFYNLTAKNISNPIAIVCDDIHLSEPIVTEAISGGSMSITGHFEPKELRTFEILLNTKTIKSDIKILKKIEVKRKQPKS